MRSHILFLVLLLLSGCVLFSRIYQFQVEALVSYPVHNLNTGLNYTTIQEAIDANETLSYHTILVDAGVYDERIIVNKSISLIGEDTENTILNWTELSWDSAVLNITANDVKVAQFSILGWAGTKVAVFSCSNVAIKDNVIWSTGMCINLYNSSNCTITGNTVVGNGLEGNNLIVLNGCSECIIENNSVLTACYEGIGLYSSSNNQIRNNQIDGDGHAVYLQSAHGNVIFNNSISDGGSFGIKLSGSSGNVIYSNTVSDCWNGIEFEGGTGNTVFGNNFERNWNQVYGSFAGNSFNESSEGNYWSDYNGTDNNQDGIGDTLYIIGENNADCYPLMGVFHSFNVYDSLTGQSELEIVISNSTIGDVALSVVIISFPGPLCYLHLTGVAGQEGTTGFCRITFPNIMMNSSSYPIREGNYPNSSQISSKILMSNGTHTTLYFTYVHPVPDLTIDVLPEFPSFLILQLFFLTTLFAVIVYRKRLVK